VLRLCIRASEVPDIDPAVLWIDPDPTFLLDADPGKDPKKII
jgi:hypothetical protein